MSADPADVVERAKQGDREAFAALVRKYQRRVYATAYQILGNHSDADDVAQDAFVRAFRSLSSFDGRSDFFTWLYRITVNTALNTLRSKRRAAALWQDSKELADEDPDGGFERSPRVWAELSEEMRRTFEAIAGLSTTLRVTLVLATVQGMAYKAIAELLGIPEGTVAWRVNEARRQVKQKLAGASDEI